MRLLIVAAVAASAFALPAAAQSSMEPRFEGSVGITQFNDGSDSDLYGVTFRASPRFGRYFGVEAEGSFGANEVDAGGVDVKLKTDVAGFVVGYLPLENGAELFARLGYGQSTFEGSLGGTSVEVEDGGFAGGIGGQYFFGNGKNGVRVDITHRKYDDIDASSDGLAIAYVRRF